MNLNLSIKQRELTALETHRKHQKEALRRREEDLRGMFKNQIILNVGSTLCSKKRCGFTSPISKRRDNICSVSFSADHLSLCI